MLNNNKQLYKYRQIYKMRHQISVSFENSRIIIIISIQKKSYDLLKDL